MSHTYGVGKGFYFNAASLIGHGKSCFRCLSLKRVAGRVFSGNRVNAPRKVIGYARLPSAVKDGGSARNKSYLKRYAKIVLGFVD